MASKGASQSLTIFQKEGKNMKNLRIATFNVNSVRSRLHVLESWLRESPVEILCLQETKVQDSEFPADFFEGLGYRVAFAGQKSYSGVALASRLPLEEVVAGFEDGEEPQDAPRIIRGLCGGIRVVNTYVPQGKSIDHEDYGYKKRFLRRVEALLREECAADRPLIWVGDMNVAPTEMDVTNPKNKKDHVCFHEDIRNLFQEIIAHLGLRDVYRKHRPGEGEFSFWDYRVKDSLNRNIGWRIDHLLATPALEGRSLGAWTERELRSMEKPSDHTAVVGEFEGF
jgi:exodeoxyribonuclease-3